MRAQYPHQKRQTFPNTIHGTVNQIDKTMFHAVVLAYTSNSDFYLVIEDTAFGDFDDLVIVTEEGKVTAIQYKHEAETTNAAPISVSSTLTKTKAEKNDQNNEEDSQGSKEGNYKIYKYYRSIEEKMPEWYENEAIVFEIATNREINEQYSTCFMEGNKRAFLTDRTGYFALTRQVIVASILKGVNKLEKAFEPKNIDECLDYLICLASNIDINDHLLSDTLDSLFKVFKRLEHKKVSKNNKIQFLKELFENFKAKKENFNQNQWQELLSFMQKNVFRYAGISHLDVIGANQHTEKDRVVTFLKKFKFVHAGSETINSTNKDTTAMKTKEALASQLKINEDEADVLYNAFFRYCIDWLGKIEVRTLNRNEILKIFKEWFDRYLLFERWVGMSISYQNLLITEIDSFHFERPSVMRSLTAFEASNKRALVIYGKPGIGKSSVILSYVRGNKKPPGDYLVLDIKLIINMLKRASSTEELSFRYFDSSKLIIFDNVEAVETCSNGIQEQFKRLLATIPDSVKSVFLCSIIDFLLRDEFFDIPNAKVDQLEIPLLEKNAVYNRFPFLYALSESKNQTFFVDTVPTKDLDKFICHPLSLNLIVAYHKKNRSLKINFSSSGGVVSMILNDLLSPEQISICRRLIYLLAQKRDTSSIRFKPGLDALIKLKIVVETENGYVFSHALYEECVFRWTIEDRLRPMLEAEEEVPHIYEAILKLLPAYQMQSVIYLSGHKLLNDQYLNFCKVSQETLPRTAVARYLLSLVREITLPTLEKEFGWMFDLLVDIAPIALLEFIYFIACDEFFYNHPYNEESINFLTTATVRCLCISENVAVTSRLFYEIMSCFDNNIWKIEPVKFEFYMNVLFVGIFARKFSLGLMSLASRLDFLNSLCVLPIEDKNFFYFQYVYAALVKAANSREIGDASYPGNNAFLRKRGSGYFHGYITSRNERLEFNENCDVEIEKKEGRYHFEAMKLLVNLNIQNIQGQHDQHPISLDDLIKIFSENLTLEVDKGSEVYDDEDENAEVILFIISSAKQIIELLDSESEMANRLGSIVTEAESRLPHYQMQPF